MSNLVTTEEYEVATKEPTSPIDAQQLLVDRPLNSKTSITDEVSLYTIPSMFSLVSIPSHFEGLNIGTNCNKVSICLNIYFLYTLKMI